MPQFRKLILPSYKQSLTEILENLSDLASSPIAQRLLDDINGQISGILDLPNLYPIYQGNQHFHKMAVNGWNYTVFYVVDKEQKTVVFYDIIHQAREIPEILRASFFCPIPKKHQK
jgi:mRNA-degrading endonuclease RelE of RelBE toxin-antitoxin system